MQKIGYCTSANDPSQFLALNQTQCERGFFLVLMGKVHLVKLVMTILKTGRYVSCLLLDLQYQKLVSVSWLMQNEGIVDAGEWFCNTNGLTIKVQ